MFSLLPLSLQKQKRQPEDTHGEIPLHVLRVVASARILRIYVSHPAMLDSE
jgi:hypothetical protein